MSVELLQTLSLVAFILAGVALLTAIALFFLLDIPKIYGDVSGRTARKAIEKIRNQNEEASMKSGAGDGEQGKLTERITRSGRHDTANRIGVGTEKLDTESLVAQAGETTVLGQTAGETTVLQAPAGETTVLQAPAGETTVLQNPAPAVQMQQADSEFSVEVSMDFTDSQEIIE